MGRQGKAFGFVESDDQDPWLGRGGGGGDQSFRGSYATSAKASSREFILIPMPLLLVILSLSSVVSGVSFLIVDVDVDRLPRGFFKGPKWVSLNSVMYEFHMSNLRPLPLTLCEIPRHDFHV